MANRLSPEDQALTRAIGEVLHYVWDPIGIAGTPQARDEYDAYMGPVFTLLRSGASEADISDHLEVLARDRLGVPPLKERSDQAAEALIAWRDHVEAPNNSFKGMPLRGTP